MGVDLYWMREAELKHARVAMLAFAGLLAQEVGFVAPGFVIFSSLCIFIFSIVIFNYLIYTAHRREPSKSILEYS